MLRPIPPFIVPRQEVRARALFARKSNIHVVQRLFAEVDCISVYDQSGHLDFRAEDKVVELGNRKDVGPRCNPFGAEPLVCCRGSHGRFGQADKTDWLSALSWRAPTANDPAERTCSGSSVERRQAVHRQPHAGGHQQFPRPNRINSPGPGVSFLISAASRVIIGVLI